MQLKWNSATTYPNIVKKIVLQRKYPTLYIISWGGRFRGAPTENDFKRK
jgi:hypothetical protein